MAVGLDDDLSSTEKVHGHSEERSEMKSDTGRRGRPQSSVSQSCRRFGSITFPMCTASRRRWQCTLDKVGRGNLRNLVTRNLEVVMELGKHKHELGAKVAKSGNVSPEYDYQCNDDLDVARAVKSPLEKKKEQKWRSSQELGLGLGSGMGMELGIELEVESQPYAGGSWRHPSHSQQGVVCLSLASQVGQTPISPAPDCNS